MRTVAECTACAKEMKNKYKYLYGAKGQPYTKALVEKLAKSYPKNYTASIKAEALRDADKGYLAGDCSFLICSIMGLPMLGSAQLKEKAVMLIRPQKYLAKEGMCLWKSGHVAYIGDNLQIYELQSTAKDFKVSSWEARAKDFTYMFVIHESPLYYENRENSPLNIYYPKYKGVGHSIVFALDAVGEKDVSFAHRKSIASKNGIVDYRGTPSQNMQLVKLLKEGKLLKS